MTWVIKNAWARISFDSLIVWQISVWSLSTSTSFYQSAVGIEHAAVNQRGLIAADYKPWSVQCAAWRVSQLLVLHAWVQAGERVAQVYVTCWRHAATKRRAAGRPTSRDTVSLKYTASYLFLKVIRVASPIAMIWHCAENRFQSLRRRYYT